jgi:diguanylate cyclase (GGDEF)-like protein/putative nucleotidyltransferase with HDIG domain
MNAYALAPLVATVAYIPMLFTTVGSRPWQKRHTLFLLYLISAMVWSLTTFFLRGNFGPQYSLLLGKIIIVLFTLTAVQLHVFTSSFFPQQKGRWLPFAYASLAVVVALVLIGYLPQSVASSGERLYPTYGPWVAVVIVPMIILAARNIFVFVKILKTTGNPVLHNQTFTLLISIIVLAVFTLVSILPWGKEYPISHFGNLLNAFILSYAIIRHRLVDIRIVIRRGTAWIALGVIGLTLYWLLLVVFQRIFSFELDLVASFTATALAFGIAIFIYKLRGRLFKVLTRAFQGSSYDYHQRLNEFTNKIHNVFSLKEQGGELLILLLKAINLKEACLLFPDSGNDCYQCQFSEPKEGHNQLDNFKLRSTNPIVKYLEREQKTLQRENLDILPAFLSLWPQEREEIEARNISMFIPLISRDRLVSILVLGEKRNSRYSLEDINIIETTTSRVAVSIEKEYLREQLREREEELSVINNSSAILSSSLDIQQIFGSFIGELKKVVEVDWATIVLIEDENLLCMALSSPENSAYQIGERVPMEGTGTGWVVTQKKTFIEPDLAKERCFNTSEHFYAHGLRNTAYLPLIAKGVVIGSFIVGSNTPNCYTQRHIRLLEQLASQIAMPLENSLLYAKAEKKARIDELTGLYNRRSLDEMIDGEISRHSRYGGSFSLAILDLDSFKTFNDTYGHLAGDGLLQEVSRNIKSAIRTADYAFRYGGDEFAVLLPQTSIQDALQVVERVRKKIAEGIYSDKIPITASIGLASWPDDGISHTDIIASADVTLYRAKRNGGNQTLCASGTLDSLEAENKPVEAESNYASKFTGIIRAFADLIDSRSYFTHNHSKRVKDYAVALAKEMKLNNDEIKIIEYCALLHDIGKIKISSELLNKPGKLTKEEWQMMKSHPQTGVEMIHNIPQLAPCINVVLHHHEWFDGSGYPDGLKGNEIPMEARLLAIADAFATMTSERSYSETRTHEIALQEIRRCSGTQFDPYMVEQFVSIFERQTKMAKKQARR